ncbi:MAG TPA: glycosyltransferase [Methylothermaceae bacterium]|nr:glycosyltransferase [Methylothermaceae bacterium]
MVWLEGAAWLAAVLWGVVVLLPWQPWRNREVLEPAEPETVDHTDVTVLIPARNEAEVIATTLRALADQAPGIRVVVVDDCSEDGTAEVARRVSGLTLQLVTGKPLPSGWSGKLWALEQGLKEVRTAKVLLLDADIELRPGMLVALLRQMERRNLDLVSIMARLRTRGFWETLLMPAFVYFFKLVYPFALSNDPRYPNFAAAAGGCILVKTEALHRCHAFASLKDALIDDCTLAARVKRAGFRTWIGLSHGVVSHRGYDRLKTIWDMVARTAYTQLYYHPGLLLLCTLLVGVMFWGPVLGLLAPQVEWLWLLTWGLMGLTYWPTLRFYRLSGWWILALPLIGTLYLAMTWDSALRYWRGERSSWKDRVYAR